MCERVLEKQASVSANRAAPGNQMASAVGLPPDKVVIGPCAGSESQCASLVTYSHCGMQ